MPGGNNEKYPPRVSRMACWINLYTRVSQRMTYFYKIILQCPMLLGSKLWSSNTLVTLQNDWVTANYKRSLLDESDIFKNYYALYIVFQWYQGRKMYFSLYQLHEWIFHSFATIWKLRFFHKKSIGKCFTHLLPARREKCVSLYRWL